MVDTAKMVIRLQSWDGNHAAAVAVAHPSAAAVGQVEVDNPPPHDSGTHVC